MSNLQWICIFLTEMESFRTTMLAFIGLEKWKTGLKHSVDYFSTCIGHPNPLIDHKPDALTTRPRCQQMTSKMMK